MKSTLGTMLLVLLAAGVPRGVGAEPAPPFVSWAYPAGGQQGTSVEVTINGQNLQGTTEVRVSGAGVSGKVTQSAETKDQRSLRSAQVTAAGTAGTATLSLTVAADAEPGLREVRVLTPGGISNRFRFHVGQIPEVSEKEPNSTLAQAQGLPGLPARANGQIMEGDRDFYRFTAKAGQTLVCEAQARSLLPYIADAVPGWADLVLTLYDAAGREVRSVDDFRWRPDPVLVFAVPRDGEYVLEVKDILLRGRGDFVYRLSIGELPYLTHAFPLGGQGGTTAPVRLFGVNLPVQQVEVALPAEGPKVVPVGLPRGGMAVNPLPFAVSPLKHAAEAEPNDAPAAAQKLEPPVVVDGRIERPGDVDHFVIAAKAGQKLFLEVQARRLDSPVDAILTVLNPKGQKAAENDDTPDAEEGMLAHQADPKLLYTFPAAGDYVVRVRDVQGKGGPEYAYRLIVAPPEPDFSLRVMPDNPRAAIGDNAAVTVLGVRKNGFAEPIEVRVEGLPAGFTVSPAVIPRGLDRVALTIHVPAGAKPGLVAPRLTGSAMIGDRKVTREALPAEEVMQAFAYKHVLPTQELVLAVAEASGMSLAWETPAAGSGGPLEIAQGGQAELKVKVTRQGTEKGGVTFKPVTAIPGVTFRAPFVPADQEQGTMTIVVAKTASVGATYNLVLTGTMRAGKETIIRTLPAVAVKVGAAAAK